MVNPANTRIDSNVEDKINNTATDDCKYIAVAGIPAELVRAKNSKRGKSSPITCITRGAAIVIALTVEISNKAKATPNIFPAFSPNAA